MKRVAVIQSSYIPWKGYFDVINSVEEFILYDDVQYTKNDWRNRNRIKTGDGTTWLTIPVLAKGRFGQLIREVEIADGRWARRHLQSLRTYYAKAPNWPGLEGTLERLYAVAADERRLSRVNELFIREICQLLGIETTIRRSMDFRIEGDRIGRLLGLCLQAGATDYLSGPSAREYMNEEAFADRGVRVHWMDYSGYPEYPQLHSPFVHEVSVLDLLLNVGPEEARNHMLSFSAEKDPLPV